jgi:drug/metabolite transporter (DMT)-like permease
MTRRKAEFLLAAVIIARSTSYLFSKIGLEDMGPFTLLAIRFLLAFSLLTVLFWKRIIHIKPKTVLYGMILGGSFFGVMTAELHGLRTTSSSTASFLENTAIVFVPLIEAILHRKLPRASVIFCSGITLTGVALLTFHGGAFTLSSGELLCILAAIFYAVSIILIDRLASKDDPVAIGMLEVGFLGLFSLIAAFIFETPHLPSNGQQWSVIFVLAIVCTVFGFTFQPVAQRHIPSERAGLFCALNPTMAAILGLVLLNERFGLQGVIGGILILSGIAASLIIKTPKIRPSSKGIKEIPRRRYLDGFRFPLHRGQA